MSDFRDANYDYRNMQDPFRNDASLDPNARGPNSAWGWIAAAVFLVVVLAIAFGAGHKPGQLETKTASNVLMPPAATQMAPPATHMVPPTAVPPSSTAPAAGTPTPPVSSAPTTPAPQGAH